MVKKMGIGGRFKEERVRLGLSQALVAEKVGATKRSVINWESETASPSAEVVAAFHNAGADGFYILTGIRSGGLVPLTAQQEQEGYSVEVLSKDEQCLVANFRACPPEEKQHITDTSALLAKPKRRRA